MGKQSVIAGPPELKSSELPKTTRRATGYLGAVLVVVLLAVSAVVGIALRLGERRVLAEETEDLAIPTVTVTHPKPGPSQQELMLPSTLEAYAESPIFSRTNGYLAHWYTDIGSHVEKGQLLADIVTPEIDQELMQARAVRDQFAAQLNLAKSSAERWETLQKMDAVAQQETDERSSGYAQAEAALASANANVRRLEQLESFKHIYAPFSGVITKRNTDMGALINAGNVGSDQGLFVIAQLNPIRVYVDVPEVYASAVGRSLGATIELRGFPSQRVHGSVARTSNAIDPATRTLHTEIDIPNPKGQLLPGSYARVYFAINVPIRRLSIPINALLFRAEGPRVAVVGHDSRVHLSQLVIGQDLGTEVEVLSGVRQTDSVIVNPSDSLEEGQQVHVIEENGKS